MYFKKAQLGNDQDIFSKYISRNKLLKMWQEHKFCGTFLNISGYLLLSYK